MVPSDAPHDFSDLYTNIGGWFERNDAGITVDEVFAWAPIAKTVAAYDASLYESAGVDHLIARRRSNFQPFVWTLPSATVTYYYPAGEVVQEVAGGFLVKWRDMGYANPGMSGADCVYQWAAYILDPATGLKIKWGAFSNTAGAAVLPTLLPSDPPDNADVVAYD